MSEEHFDVKAYLDDIIDKLTTVKNDIKTKDASAIERLDSFNLILEKYTVYRLLLPDGLSYIDLFEGEDLSDTRTATLHYYPNGLKDHIAYEINDEDVLDKLFSRMAEIMWHLSE